MFKWRKWNRVTHRDLGYFFVGMTIVYGLSGIALNHMRDWNPNYIIQTKEIEVNAPLYQDNISEEFVLSILRNFNEQNNFKKFYFPDEGTLKIFLQGGSIRIDLDSGMGLIEKIGRRPVFYEVNFLHYNPGVLWTWFSDIFSASLIILAITGLFIIRGKNGITGRGAWLTVTGIIVPLLFLIRLL